MIEATTVDAIKNLLYQCKFQQCVRVIDAAIAAGEYDQESFLLQLLKAQALFELHQVLEAKSLLTALARHQGEQSDLYLYVMAKLSYHDNDHVRAESLFKLLSDRSESVRDYFRANLGLANVYFAMKRYHELQPILLALEEASDMVASDEHLSLLSLKANAFYHAHGMVKEAKQTLHAIIHEAGRWGWSYFIGNSLLCLATMAQERGRTEELETTLSLLRCYLDPEETVYRNYLVNEQFKDSEFAMASPIQLDPEYKRVCVRGSWVALHDKPLLYRFLELLHSAGGFVGKERIAHHLWEGEAYKPRMHDPRIFDIARRIRTMIESYENQPVCLLSGRHGYKLASSSILEASL